MNRSPARSRRRGGLSTNAKRVSRFSDTNSRVPVGGLGCCARLLPTRSGADDRRTGGGADECETPSHLPPLLHPAEHHRSPCCRLSQPVDWVANASPEGLRSRRPGGRVGRPPGRAGRRRGVSSTTNRTFRDKSTLSRFENGKTTPADVASLVTQYEELGAPVAGAAQRSANATDGWMAALWCSLGLLALVDALVPDDTGVDVIRVGAIVAGLVTIVSRDPCASLPSHLVLAWRGGAPLPWRPTHRGRGSTSATPRRAFVAVTASCCCWRPPAPSSG
jgi:hypothetical protein